MTTLAKKSIRNRVVLAGLAVATNSFCLASHATPVNPKVSVDKEILERFRDCSLDLRYQERLGLIDSLSRQIPQQRLRLKTKDGYASIRLDSSLYDLHVSELTIPSDVNGVHVQYRLRIDAPSDSVVEVLTKAWGVRFEEVGPDGMDSAVRKSFTMRPTLARVSVFSTNESRGPSILECTPPKSSQRYRPPSQ